MDVIEYKLIDQHSAIELNQKVNLAIREGWQPWGAPTVTFDDSNHKAYCQAVVKFAKPKGSQ